MNTHRASGSRPTRYEVTSFFQPFTHLPGSPRVAVAGQVNQLASRSSTRKKLRPACVPASRRRAPGLAPLSAFSRLLLPTFERPRKATSGSPSRGNWPGAAALPANVCDLRVPRTPRSLVTRRRVRSPRLQVMPPIARASGRLDRSTCAARDARRNERDLQHLVHVLDELEPSSPSSTFFGDFGEVLLVLARAGSRSSRRCGARPAASPSRRRSAAPCRAA